MIGRAITRDPRIKDAIQQTQHFASRPHHPERTVEPFEITGLGAVGGQVLLLLVLLCGPLIIRGADITIHEAPRG